MIGDTLGKTDQGSSWPDGSTLAQAASIRSVLPTLYISWYQAAALCSNSGKYLCSAAEWVDACDGQYGAGGSKYPYGNEWREGWCAARLGEEPQIYDGVQETGSHEQCVSAWGTYDQIGNAWEWVDPQQEDEQGRPIAHKVGASYYSGGGNIRCESSAVADHPPSFAGVIGARCCASPTLGR